MGTTTSDRLLRAAGFALSALVAAAVPAMAQVQPPARPVAPATPGPQPGRPAGTQGPLTGRPAPTGPAVTSTGISAPTDYVIGPDDVLGIVFWRDAEMSGDVTVRPDGMITLPLLRDIKAAGLRPDELRAKIVEAAAKLIEDPNVSVVVRQINSRNVFITGQVLRPGGYPVSGQMTVLQLISIAGGLTEFANGKAIITRADGGNNKPAEFNYNDVAKGKKMEQNIVLKPGDTIIVR
jgi:polysaccharide biosynthesis/export protein